MNKIKELLLTIEHDLYWRGLLINLSQEMKPKQAVYVRKFPTILGVETMQARIRYKPLFDWFGLAKVIKFTRTPIESFSHLDAVINRKKSRFDSDNMTFNKL